MTRRGRTIISVIAALIMLAALIWLCIINMNDPLQAVVRAVNGRGYAITSGDLYVYDSRTDTDIKSVIASGAGITQSDIESMAELSRASGFDADITKSGEVTILLANSKSGVITLYLVDGVIELAFIQTGEGEVRPL